MSAQRELSEKVTSRHWARYSFAYYVQLFFLIYICWVFLMEVAAFCFHLERKWEVDIFDTPLLAQVFKGNWNNTLKRQIILFSLPSPHLTTPTHSPTPVLLSHLSLLPALPRRAAGNFFSLWSILDLPGYNLQLLNSQKQFHKNMTSLEKLSQKGRGYKE